MFKPGSIRKIQVKDFVTYSYVEMCPGPNLNMIIGPNGTGKSTMVAAIILGLGGTPKTIGRGTRISEYVKHGCDEATINIYLEEERQNSYLKITREFNMQEKSFWKINGHRSSIDEVRDCIKKFNIQVDNLCQFLPQDRVADFAKLNKKDLLRQTQIALCREDLIKKQDALVDAREKHKSLLNQAEKQVQKLQEARDANSRLEGRVHNFNKQKKLKEKIVHIDRKIAWLQYEEAREKLGDIKNDKIKAQELYDQHRKVIKPMEHEIHVHQQSLRGMQQSYSKTLQETRKAEENINTANDKIEALSYKVREIKDELNTELAEIDQREKLIEEAVAKLEDMKKLRAEMNQGEDERLAISSEITKCTNYNRTLQDRKEELEQSVMDTRNEIRALQNDQNRIENVKQIRLEQLRRINNDAYTAVLWLRNNKNLFKGEVFEPIMLELNVLNQNQAKYVESIVPMRDRLAFTCTEKSDMNLFIRCLREQQGLSINVIYSGPASDRYNQPNIPIEHLRKFGFYTYLNSLFTAPEPIMRYLCQTYKLHNIPIGDENVNNCYENLPKSLIVFFSDKYRFAISYSKYSGEKSTRQNVVTGDGGLSVSLDVVQLEQIKGRCNELRKKAEHIESQVENYNAQINKVEEKVKAFREKLSDIRKQKHQAEAIQNKIQVAQKNLNDMRRNKKSHDEIRQLASEKMDKLIQTMVLIQEVLKKEFEKFSGLMTESDTTSVRIEILRHKIEYLENQIADCKRQMREAEETLNLVTDKYNAVMKEAKAQLMKAKGLSEGFTPADDGFDQFREIYDQISGDLEELNSIKENLNIRIACLNTAEGGEMQEYEDRLKLIETITSDIETTNTEINQISVKINRLEQQWLTPLKDLLAAINLRFSSSFERMGCAGEIDLCTGDSEKNYSEYGISIKVTYRSGEPLQELNATVQSGGERAVATAAFMLALQELTPVPFRCVDEINQGMDADNERRIFELIVETTSQENTAQYFLITPKLIPNLNYSRQLVVHVVHNGPFINPDRKWGSSKFCNPQKVQIN